MKRALVLFLVTTSLLYSTLNANTDSRLSTAVGEPDFVLAELPIMEELQPGAYEIVIRIMNSGSAAAVPGDVPVAWEDLYYELVLDNGTGMLNETAMDYDLDGDGDKTATYNVTWFHNESRQWDAIVNNSIEEVHAYSLWEGPTGSPWSNQTSEIGGMSKLFKLGNQIHVLYGADNYTAFFGFRAAILAHAGPFLELEVTSSLNVNNTEIGGNPVEVNHTGTRKVYSGGSWTTTARYIITSPALELGAGVQVTCSFKLFASETTTAYLGFFMNWSPDGNARRKWVLLEIPVAPVPAIDQPLFLTTDHSYTPGTCELRFNATVINAGLPATAGTVLTSQEDVIYDIEMFEGSGMLDESEVGMDLNGDGDQTDTFNVTWAPSGARQWDANITDGTAEIHAYAIIEFGAGYNELGVRNYSVNGQSKVFQLGSVNHSLYSADLYAAEFGLGNVVIVNHTSPLFMFGVRSTEFDALSRELEGNLTVEGFKINGQDAELNYTTSVIEYLLDFNPGMYKLYYVSSPGLEIGAGEQVTYSCTIKASSNVTFDTLFTINWSPNGIQRYIWRFQRVEEIDLTISCPDQPLPDNTSSTTTTTATTTTPTSSSTTGVPGFTFLAPAALVVPVILTGRRRKRV